MWSDAMLSDAEPMPWVDEIGAEVRASRDRLADAVDYDLARHWAQLQALEADERAHGRIFVTEPDQSGAAA